MKKSSTIVLSFLMIGFGLIAMPTHAQADSNSYYGEPYGSSEDPNKFLDVKNAKIGIHDDIIKKIFFETRGEIPEDGSEGIFGYGVVTQVDDTLNVIATTTHEGLYDSELQLEESNIYSPIWHNHFVELQPSPICQDAVGDPGLAIYDLSFESPGEINIVDNKAILTNLPESADKLLTPGEITPGSDIFEIDNQQVVGSFRLVVLNNIVDPLEEEFDPLKAVCIADLQLAENVKIFELNGFEDENNYYYDNENSYYNKEPQY